MTDPTSYNDLPPADGPLPPKSWIVAFLSALVRWAVPAWIIILGLVGLIVWGQTVRHDRSAVAASASESKLDNILYEMQMRYLIGGNEVFRGQGVDFYEQARAMERGTIGQRLRFIVAAGEMAGPVEARAKLAQLRQDIAKFKAKPTKSQQRVIAALNRMYNDYEGLRFKAPSLTAAERMSLRNNLGWLAELALTPPGPSAFAVMPWFGDRFTAIGGVAMPAALADLPSLNSAARIAVLEPAQRSFLTILIAVTLALLAGFLGVIALIVFTVLFLIGKLKAGIRCGITHGHVYAETFAVWMLLYLGLSLAAHFIDVADGSMLTTAAAMFLSLLALAWPVLRGVPWRQVREDIGWTWGRRPLLEPLIGVGCYLMALPLAAIGLAITLVLMVIQQGPPTEAVSNPFAPTSFPAHPVVEILAFGDLFARLQVILLASVAAPIMEETMFRGVLYRHLREATNRWGGVISFLLSGTLVSFIFAVIHPQGWVAVPVLMALAYGFTIAREWRGTLIPAMVGHGLSNGLVTTIVMLALG